MIVQVNIPELVLSKLLKDITAHLHVYILAREKGMYMCFCVCTHIHTLTYSIATCIQR